MGSRISLWDVGARGENWWDAALRTAHMLVRSVGNSAAALGTEPSTPLKTGSAWLVCDYWPTDVKVSVTCLVKRKKFEGMGERGLLCNQLHQWLIIISMREISRHTQGLSKPPTLYIYLSFFLLLLPTSCVLPFCSLHILFLFPALCHFFLLLYYLSPFPLLVLSFPFPAFYLIFKSQVPFCFFCQPKWGFAFLCAYMYNYRVELWNLKWIKGNHYLRGLGTWQQVVLLKLADIYVGTALRHHLAITLCSIHSFVFHCFWCKWMATCPAVYIKLWSWNVSIKTIKSS